MACSAYINVSQGSVATYARRVGIFSVHLTDNLTRNLPMEQFLNRLRFGRNMVMSLWPRCFDPPWTPLCGVTTGCRRLECGKI